MLLAVVIAYVAGPLIVGAVLSFRIKRVSADFFQVSIIAVGIPLTAAAMGQLDTAAR